MLSFNVCRRFLPRHHQILKKTLFFRQLRQLSDESQIEEPIVLAKSYPQVIFSGIQPTGTLHLGNYFGAVRRWVDLQEKGLKTIYSIVDMHSMTAIQNPADMKNNILKMAACLLACGIDPEKSIFFIQSTVPEHTQLSWILGCLISLARLDNLPQYKEKTSKLKKIPLGLLSYPVLQTADILLYKATHIPVGEDQTQHLQIARQLARTFNATYGECFPYPDAIIDEGASSRLKSLRNPDKKMSKSEADPRSRIEFTDTPDIIVEKFKKSVTDCTSAITFDPVARPGVSNLLQIHSLVTGQSVDEICERVANQNTGQYKMMVAEVVVECLKPIRNKIIDYLDDPEYLERTMLRGADKASAIAEKTWMEVKEHVGLCNLGAAMRNKISIG